MCCNVWNIEYYFVPHCVLEAQTFFVVSFFYRLFLLPLSSDELVFLLLSLLSLTLDLFVVTVPPFLLFLFLPFFFCCYRRELSLCGLQPLFFLTLFFLSRPFPILSLAIYFFTSIHCRLFGLSVLLLLISIIFLLCLLFCLFCLFSYVYFVFSIFLMFLLYSFIFVQIRLFPPFRSPPFSLFFSLLLSFPLFHIP